MNHVELLRAHLACETEGELTPLQANDLDATRRKDAARRSEMTVRAVLREMEALSFQGFVCMRIDGELVFSGVPSHVPEFLKEIA